MEREGKGWAWMNERRKEGREINKKERVTFVHLIINTSNYIISVTSDKRSEAEATNHKDYVTSYSWSVNITSYY